MENGGKIIWNPVSLLIINQIIRRDETIFDYISDTCIVPLGLRAS